MTTKEKAKKLEEIAEWENTETGEFWYELTRMYLRDKDYMTDEFHLQIGVEVEVQYQLALDMIDDEDFPIEIPDDLRGTLV